MAAISLRQGRKYQIRTHRGRELVAKYKSSDRGTNGSLWHRFEDDAGKRVSVRESGLLAAI